MCESTCKRNRSPTVVAVLAGSGAGTHGLCLEPPVSHFFSAPNCTVRRRKVICHRLDEYVSYGNEDEMKMSIMRGTF